MATRTHDERANEDWHKEWSPEYTQGVRERSEEKMRPLPTWQLPSWTAAHARLVELLPAARRRIFAPFSMKPDNIIAAANLSGTPFESRTVYNWERNHKDGIGTKSWHDYEDDEIFDLLFGEFPLTPGALWFVPHDCFWETGRPGRDQRADPYLVDATDLRDLVCKWPNQWNWSGQLDQDTLFIWRDTPRITIIHHEGWLYNLVVLGNSIPPVKAGTTQGVPGNPAE